VPDDDNVACGPWKSSIELHGERAQVQWSTGDEAATVDSIVVWLTATESAMSAVQLASEVAKVQTSLELDPSSSTSSAVLVVRGRPDHVLLIKPGERVAYVSLEGCLD